MAQVAVSSFVSNALSHTVCVTGQSPMVLVYHLTEGPEMLYVERRGRGSKGRPPKLPKEVEEDLLKEVQRLRAENEYLKKLQALVMERKQNQLKK